MPVVKPIELKKLQARLKIFLVVKSLAFKNKTCMNRFVNGRTGLLLIKKN